jgi:DNA-binding NarL/FixJ family response regulator
MLTLDQIVRLAEEPLSPTELASPEDPPAIPEPDPYVRSRRREYGLTPREIDVLRLVAAGLTDAQIASKLVISPRTVGKHLQTIYEKLDLHSRSAATRWAMEHNLD